MYKDMKDYDISRIAYKNTIRDYENSAPNSNVLEYVGQAYHGIGVTFMEQQKHEEAIAAFQKALDYKKNSGSIFKAFDKSKPPILRIFWISIFASLVR